MVVLELLTRRQPCSSDTLADQGRDLRNWILDNFLEKAYDLLDQELLEDCSSDNICKEQMLYLLRVGLFCTRGEPQSRPSMGDVLGMLMYIVNLGVEQGVTRTIDELASEMDSTLWELTRDLLPSLHSTHIPHDEAINYCQGPSLCNSVHSYSHNS